MIKIKGIAIDAQIYQDNGATRTSTTSLGSQDKGLLVAASSKDNPVPAKD